MKQQLRSKSLFLKLLSVCPNSFLGYCKINYLWDRRLTYFYDVLFDVVPAPFAHLHYSLTLLVIFKYFLQVF